MNLSVEMPNAMLPAVGTPELAPIRWSAERLRAMLVAGARWIQRKSRALWPQQASRRLRVAETVSLGEKRFVSIVEVDGQQFLLGGSASGVALLAKLEQNQRGPSESALPDRSFGDVLSGIPTSPQVGRRILSEEYVEELPR